MKEQDLDTPSIEKRFAYTFLQQLITYVDEAHGHMLEFGESLAFTPESISALRLRIPLILIFISDAGIRPKGEKIPHEQQVKFFGKVRFILTHFIAMDN